MDSGNQENRNSGIFEDPNEHPLSLVREGMRVVDANGEDLGEVKFVKMGNPEAVTTGDEADRDGGLVQDIAEALFRARARCFPGAPRPPAAAWFHPDRPKWTGRPGSLRHGR